MFLAEGEVECRLKKSDQTQELSLIRTSQFVSLQSLALAKTGVEKDFHSSRNQG